MFWVKVLGNDTLEVAGDGSENYPSSEIPQ